MTNITNPNPLKLAHARYHLSWNITSFKKVNKNVKICAPCAQKHPNALWVFRTCRNLLCVVELHKHSGSYTMLSEYKPCKNVPYRALYIQYMQGHVYIPIRHIQLFSQFHLWTQSCVSIHIKRQNLRHFYAFAWLGFSY